MTEKAEQGAPPPSRKAVEGSPRRTYLKAMGAGGVLGALGLAGCVSSLPWTGSDPIHVGTVLPLTGDLADYGRTMERAVELATEHVNSAGGPRDRTLELHTADSETAIEPATRRYDELTAEFDIVGVVGAAASPVSAALAEKATGDQIMQVSPASTSPVLAGAGRGDDGRKYFARTAPNDWQQGAVMSQILSEFIQTVQGDDGDLMGDIPEIEDAAFLHVDNAYGERLAEIAARYFEGEHGVLRFVPYHPDETDYAAALETLTRGEPDAMGVIGYPESARGFLEQWLEGDYSGRFVLSEALHSPALLDSFAPTALDGIHISTPSVGATESVRRFRESFDSNAWLFAAHAYDATFLSALALQRAGSVSGSAIAETIRSVSQPPGQTVRVDQFAEAKRLDAQEITYQGASGPTSLNRDLEPLCRFDVVKIVEDRQEVIHEYEQSQFLR